MAKPKNYKEVSYWIMFIGYLVVLAHFMFFSDEFGRGVHDDYSYNLILFQEIRRFFNYRDLLGRKAVILNLGGNVGCFVPFGFILPLISRRSRSFINTVGLSAFFSLGIEITQLVFRIGSFDVDDIFLNTIGGIVGYLLVYILRRGSHGSNS